jgi:Mg2+ and Co2+ transporter CorA
VTVRAVLYDANGDDREIDLTAERPRLGDTRFLWIDIDTRATGDLSIAADALGLERKAFNRLAQEDRHARILRLPDRVVLTIGAIDPGDADVRRREVDIVIGQNHVLTVHDGAVDAVDQFRDYISDEQELGRIDAAGVLAGLLDSIFTSYFRQIEAIEREIDALDELAVRSRRDGAFLSTVLTLRRRIALLRRALSPNREALLPLERPDFELRTDLGVVWPGVIQRLERAIDGVENARDLLVGSFDLYLGRASQRTNDVMKALTLVSSIALPGVVLAGIMGMNFKLSFFDDPSNFFVVIAAMVLFSAGILIVARMRSWI